MSKGGGVSIPNPWTIKLGSDGSTIHSDSDLEIQPVTVTTNIAVTQPIVSQSTSTSDSTAKVDMKLEPLDIKVEPLKVSSDSTSAIDVKPLALDSCQTLKLAPLPPIRVEQPYSQHFGITFMGVELWGLNVSGVSEMFLHSPPRPRHLSVEIGERRDDHTPGPDHGPATTGRAGGLRMRVK